MPRHAALSPFVIVAALATIACENPTDVGRTTPTTAGSFDASPGCLGVLESPSGGVYIVGPSQTPLGQSQATSRSADGTVIHWTKVFNPLLCTAAVAASGDLLISTRDSVFSLKAQDGAIRWRFSRGARVDVFRIATSSTGRIFLTSRPGGDPPPPETLYALSEANGSVLWSRTLDYAGILYVDDARSTVYYTSYRRAVAMDLGSGAVKWDTTSNGWGSLAILADGSLLAQKLHPEGNFLTDPTWSRIDAIAADGTRIWQSAPQGVNQYIAGGPVVDDAGTVYSATSGSDQFRFLGPGEAGVYAVSVATGETKWKHDFYLIRSRIVVDANRTVFVIAQAAADSATQVYGLRDGAIVSASTPAPCSAYRASPLMIHSNKLLYYTCDTRVGYIPTAGVSSSAPWPMDQHDAKRSAHR